MHLSQYRLVVRHVPHVLFGKLIEVEQILHPLIMAFIESSHTWHNNKCGAVLICILHNMQRCGSSWLAVCCAQQTHWFKLNINCDLSIWISKYLPWFHRIYQSEFKSYNIQWYFLMIRLGYDRFPWLLLHVFNLPFIWFDVFGI